MSRPAVTRPNERPDAVAAAERCEPCSPASTVETAGTPSDHDSPFSFTGFLTRDAKTLVYLLRIGSKSLGWDYGETAWDALARELELPAAATLARRMGGSWENAKWVAGVG